LSPTARDGKANYSAFSHQQLTVHPPHWFWTRKVNAKIVSRVLSPEQVEEYRSWFESERTLRALIRQLEALGIAAIDADPRSPRRSRRGSRT